VRCLYGRRSKGGGAKEEKRRKKGGDWGVSGRRHARLGVKREWKAVLGQDPRREDVLRDVRVNLVFSRGHIIR
jgi:hypothetical protein